MFKVHEALKVHLTQQEVPKVLQVPKVHEGTRGAQGTTGAQGTAGVQGTRGAQGTPNTTRGAQGTAGAQGTKGFTGTTGVQGTAGDPGNIGVQGPPAPPSASILAKYVDGVYTNQNIIHSYCVGSHPGSSTVNGYWNDIPANYGDCPQNWKGLIASVHDIYPDNPFRPRYQTIAFYEGFRMILIIELNEIAATYPTLGDIKGITFTYCLSGDGGWYVPTGTSLSAESVPVTATVRIPIFLPSGWSSVQIQKSLAIEFVLCYDASFEPNYGTDAYNSVLQHYKLVPVGTPQGSGTSYNTLSSSSHSSSSSYVVKGSGYAGSPTKYLREDGTWTTISQPNSASSWADGSGNLGIVSPTLTHKSSFSYSGSNVINPPTTWVDTTQGEWVAIPIVIDNKGQLVAAMPVHLDGWPEIKK